MDSMKDDFGLPQNLSTLAFERFDELHSNGKLHYGPSTPEVVQYDGFTFQFSIPPAVSSKPILPPSDPSRSKPGGPFLHPDPQFVLCRVGPSHTLELNKHCILRPMYILHTTEYEKQKDDLDLDDLRATWAVLGHLGAEGQGVMAIYNCGAEAGASQGHKHVQIFPRPKKEVFELWADRVKTREGRISTENTIPYKHALTHISKNATAEDVCSCYEMLLSEIRPILEENGTEDYNMVLVKEWMLMIPRRHHGRNAVEANAVGMMGMVWLKSQEEREGWTELGMTEHLRYLGVPT